MFKFINIISVPVLLALFSASALFADEKSTTAEVEESTFLDGSPWLNFRYRYEYADQDGKAEQAGASTLRSRVGLKTKSFHGFKGLVEVEDVTEVGSDRYNNTINGRTDYPVVADVEGTEINRAHITYEDIPNTEVGWGRRALILDDARFIGDVGWRQNNQTFDSALLKNKSFENIDFTYAYIHNVNRVFGDDSPMGDLDSKIHLAHLHYSEFQEAKVSLYGYFMDFDSAVALSSNTYGAMVEGKIAICEDMDILHKFELAYQEDAGDNPTDYDTYYYRAEPGIRVGNITAKIGYEVLGSDDGTAGFVTPLSTAHKFNGFADLFLSTPATGLQDLYFWLGYGAKDLLPYGPTNVFAVYHEFEADSGPLDYGSEWDVNVVQEFDNYYTGVKYANYQAKDFGSDLERLIFTFGVNFS